MQTAAVGIQPAHLPGWCSRVQLTNMAQDGSIYLSHRRRCQIIQVIRPFLPTKPNNPTKFCCILFSGRGLNTLVCLSASLGQYTGERAAQLEKIWVIISKLSHIILSFFLRFSFFRQLLCLSLLICLILCSHPLCFFLLHLSAFPLADIYHLCIDSHRFDPPHTEWDRCIIFHPSQLDSASVLSLSKVSISALF